MIPMNRVSGIGTSLGSRSLHVPACERCLPLYLPRYVPVGPDCHCILEPGCLRSYFRIADRVSLALITETLMVHLEA